MLIEFLYWIRKYTLQIFSWLKFHLFIIIERACPELGLWRTQAYTTLCWSGTRNTCWAHGRVQNIIRATTVEHTLADRGHLFKHGKAELTGHEAELRILPSGCHLKEHGGRKCPHKLWKSVSPEMGSWIETSCWTASEFFFCEENNPMPNFREKCRNWCLLHKLGWYLSSEAQWTRGIRLYLYEVIGRRSFWNISSGAQIVKNSNNKKRHDSVFWIFF